MCGGRPQHHIEEEKRRAAGIAAAQRHQAELDRRAQEDRLRQAQEAARKQQERRERAIDVGFAPQFFEVGELVGERRQWNQLQSSERKREGASEVRRAFNIYTTNLNFNSNKYQWVGSSQEKSQRIRSDRLPTTTDVIRSDLDARDLYRNQVQTSLEDAVAEFIYQKKECGDNVQKFDATELLDILKLAQTSVDKWFGFIPDQDVKLALEAVQREQA